MNIKPLLSLLLAAGSMLPVEAEGFAKVNLGSTPLQRDIVDGEYTNLDKITILFNNQNQNCYITDWSKMNAKLNGTPVEIKALYSDENGYAHALEILLGSPGEDINTVTFKYPPVYINKDVDDQAEIVASSLMTCSLKYRITLNSTLESADDFVRSDLPKHVQNLKYTYDNPPGEYGALVGDYGIDFSDMYVRYYPNPHNGNYRPYVMDDQGKLVTYCTEQIDRSYVVRDDDVKFHITIDNPITIPGTYWIVYISDGDYRYYDSTGKYYNLRHLANMKIGPYVVKEQAGGEMHTVDAQLGLWNKEEYESDMLPSVIANTIVNASAVVCHKSATSGYASYVVHEADSVAVSAISVRNGNRFEISLPSNWYRGAGEYKVVVTDPNAVFDAFTSTGERVSFATGEEVSMDFTVIDPALPESLDFYVRTAGAESYEIGTGETVNVRLMHESQTLGMKIYVKWTPDGQMQSAMADAGFDEHTGDVEISSAGRLDYYTERGGVTSPVRSINFTERINASIDTPEIIDMEPAEAGMYDLRGVRVVGTPATGIYIRRNTDGSVRKVIVR